MFLFVLYVIVRLTDLYSKYAKLLKEKDNYLSLSRQYKKQCPKQDSNLHVLANTSP